jgi:hypothetical protein
MKHPSTLPANLNSYAEIINTLAKNQTNQNEMMQE